MEVAYSRHRVHVNRTPQHSLPRPWSSCRRIEASERHGGVVMGLMVRRCQNVAVPAERRRNMRATFERCRTRAVDSKVILLVESATVVGSFGPGYYY